MKTYIFYTSEGYTQEPNNCDIENCQVISWGKGNTPEEAFENLKQENEYLEDTSFDDVICQELVSEKQFYFSLKTMKLKNFIQKLENIAKKHGDDAEVVMADNIPVVNPVFSKNYSNIKSVIITDGK